MNALSKTILFLKDVENGKVAHSQTVGYAIFLSDETSTKISVEFNSFNLPYSDEISIIVCLAKRVFITVAKPKRKFEMEFDYPFDKSDGISICLLNDGFPTHYGGYKTPIYDLNGLINYAKKEFEKKTENTNCEKESCADDTKEKCRYDDELIATENYFENVGENYENNLYIKNEISNLKDKAQEKGSYKESETFINEKDDYDCKENYFLKIKDKLFSLLNTHEKFADLDEIFENSNFVKIPYDDTRFYIVGVIKEKEDLKYLCYGVKGTYDNPPKELDGYCRFIPKNCYELTSDGYYLIFQDSKSGKIVT